jgi:SAM-dependent methyltransferase
MFTEIWQRLIAYRQPWDIVYMAIQCPSLPAHTTLSNPNIATVYLQAIWPTSLGGKAPPPNISARDHAFAQLYLTLQPHFVAYERTTDLPALVGSASGVVLDLGPAVGNSLEYFDKSKITHIYGIEPNPAFVEPLLAKAKELGLQDKYTIIVGGVEDEALLASYGIKEDTVDTISCVQVLCSVDDPQATAKLLWRLLKPGGALVFWEHQQSLDFWTRLVQRNSPT